MVDYRLPAWVGWLAQDADGTWWEFEHEPNRHERGWYENEVGRRVQVGGGTPNANCAQTLMRRADDGAASVRMDENKN